MGLMKILRKMKQEEKEVRLLMLGLDNAGKTTILKKFNGEPVDTISPTLGFNIKTLEYEGYKLNIWDIGGQKTIRSYWRNYFEATDGLVWVVDSADRQRLEDCKQELDRLLQEERLAGATLLIFANKQDLPGAMTAPEIRDFLQLEEIKRRHWCILACSAYTGEVSGCGKSRRKMPGKDNRGARQPQVFAIFGGFFTLNAACPRKQGGGFWSRGWMQESSLS
ncbi:ARL2 [Symbiodinium sp. KB8]|nr:ARL2 [Symbiodinium sp. KB8]